MTILQTYRWKCDYCGAVSPGMGQGERPMGWIRGLYGLAPMFVNTEVHHFCCSDHERQWMLEYPPFAVSRLYDGTNDVAELGQKLTRLVE